MSYVSDLFQNVVTLYESTNAINAFLVLKYQTVCQNNILEYSTLLRNMRIVSKRTFIILLTVYYSVSDANGYLVKGCDPDDLEFVLLTS